MVTRARWMTAFALAVLLLSGPAAAQTPCRDKVQALDGTVDARAPEAALCRSLAIRAAHELRDRLPSKESAAQLIDPADVQPAASGAAAAPGTPAQDAGARTVKTVGLLGVSGAVQTDADSTRPMVALTLNPLGLVAQADAASFARRSRITQFTVLVPASFAEGAPLGQVGARLTFDVMGLVAGDRFSELANGFVSAHQAALGARGELTHALEQALSAAPDTRACIEALFSTTPSAPAISTACGVDLDREARAAVEHDAAFRAAKERFREETDKFHLGATLELDVPLSRTSGAPLRTALVAASSLKLAPLGAWALEGRADLGADFIRPGAGVALAEGFGGTAAVSLALTGSVLTVPLSVVAGVRGHTGAALTDAVGDVPNQAGQYLLAEATARAPISSSGIELSLSLSWPAVSWDGQRRDPTVSVSLDYQRLLAGLLGEAK